MIFLQPPRGWGELNFSLAAQILCSLSSPAKTVQRQSFSGHGRTRPHTHLSSARRVIQGSQREIIRSVEVSHKGSLRTNREREKDEQNDQAPILKRNLGQVIPTGL